MSVLNVNVQKSERIAFYLWVAGLFALIILSLLPPGSEPSFTNIVGDKIRHFTAYAILSLIACHAVGTWRSRASLCALTLMVSILVEFLQPLTGRDFEVLDIVANMSGILAGMAIMFLLLRRRAAKAPG